MIKYASHTITLELANFVTLCIWSAKITLFLDNEEKEKRETLDESK